MATRIVVGMGPRGQDWKFAGTNILWRTVATVRSSAAARWRSTGLVFSSAQPWTRNVATQAVRDPQPGNSAGGLIVCEQVVPVS